MDIGRRWRFWRAGVGALSVAAVATSAAMADVNVTLMPTEPAGLVGREVRLRLVLTPDSPELESFASLKIILDWDPAQLRLVGQERDDAVDLLSAGFPSDPSNLNEAPIPQDGDAVFIALASLGEPLEVDEEGTLITTFVFEALVPTSGTAVAIPLSAGQPPTTTTVFDGETPNLHITGSLIGTSVPIYEEPTRLVLTVPDHPVAAGSTITAVLSMENLNGQEAAGFTAALAFDPAELAFVEGTYTAAPFGSTLISPIAAIEGTLDLAAAIRTPDQTPSSADATLVTLTFETVQSGCVSSLHFRDATPGTRLTTLTGAPVGPLMLVDGPPPGAPCDCPCELDGAAGIDVFDLLAYLDLWFTADPAADRTSEGDGRSIDVFDLLTYLDCWFAPGPGCV